MQFIRHLLISVMPCHTGCIGLRLKIRNGVRRLASPNHIHVCKLYSRNKHQYQVLFLTASLVKIMQMHSAGKRLSRAVTLGAKTGEKK
jgi:hypothetical protein